MIIHDEKPSKTVTGSNSEAQAAANARKAQEHLDLNGINMRFVFDTSEVADALEPAMPRSVLDDFPSTVLLGNAGRTLWDVLEQKGLAGADPVDDFSISVATDYIELLGMGTRAMIIYPSNYQISLTKLAERAGWSFSTPMGVMIHPEFGPWFAYRAVLLVRPRLEASAPLNASSPCESCADRPCQSACPSGAVGEIGEFALETCSRYRLLDESPCERKCLSRIACPVGTEYRYGDSQMQYFYGRSRKTLARHFGAIK